MGYVRKWSCYSPTFHLGANRAASNTQASYYNATMISPAVEAGRLKGSYYCRRGWCVRRLCYCSLGLLY